jgi:sugar O-acyltransferase (sialic acid O-acetyltransferase NeuD family)
MEDNRTPIVIIGTDPSARLALDVALALDVLVYGCISDEEDQVPLTEVNDIPVVAALGSRDSDALLKDENIRRFVASMDPEKRQTLVVDADEHAGEMITLVHPSAVVSPYARIGRGNLIQPFASIQSNASIGNFNVIGAHVSLGPDAEIGDYATIHDGVRIGRGATIENEAVIGAGAIIYAEVTVEEGAVVGPGAVVLKDVAAGETVFGNPARSS